MSDIIEIDKKVMHTIKVAATATGYSRDYITKLARDTKIIATQVGRMWYIDLESLKQYAAVSEMEQEIRQKHLSEERKRERELLEKNAGISLYKKESVKKQQRHAQLTIAYLFFGGIFAAAWTLDSLALYAPNVQTQLASAPSQMVVSGNTIFSTELDLVELSTFETIRTLSFADVDEGVLLLPGQDFLSNSSIDEGLFSDNVSVRTDGQRTYLQPVDNEGEVIGKEIPFVLVPLRNIETP